MTQTLHPHPPHAENTRTHRVGDILEALPNFVFTADHLGALTYANSRTLAYFGMSFDMLKGNQWIAIVHLDDLPATLTAIAHHLAEGTDMEIEVRLRRHDHQYRWFLIRTAPLRKNDAGHVTEWIGSMIDIHDRKASEDALQTRQNQLSLAHEAAKLGTFEWNIQANTSWWSPELETLMGLAPGTHDGSHNFLIRMLHPEDRDRVAAEITAAVPTGSFYADFRIICPDGAVRWMHTRAKTIFDENKQPLRLIGVCFDVSQRKRTEQSLLEARALAEAASQAKDRFVAMLSHELRTPLNPALLLLSNLTSDPTIPARLREDLATIKRNIDLETHLINDLLDATRISQGKLALQREPASVYSLLRDAWNTCTASALEKNIAVSWELDARNEWVMADPARLQQVFWNLLKNAIKFTPAHGDILIRTENTNDNQIRIIIRDTGVGISHDALQKIFTPFDQGNPNTNKQYGGLGLGLAIARGIIDLHGGSISVHSDGPHKGAAFSITLDTTTPAQLTAPQTPAEPPIAPLRLLLVEDHIDTLRTMVRILEAHGHSVKAARTIAESFDLLQSHSFDAVITDLGLPDGSGHDIIRSVKSRTPHTPIIALSGFGMADDVQTSIHAGATAHLTKPLNLELLKETLASLPHSPP